MAVLALQRAAGNAAVLRALQRRPRGRLLQRAPLHRVMPLTHNLWFGMNKRWGYAVKRDMPEGYHVTIYPELSDAQQAGAWNGLTLGQLPAHESVEFTLFNVTRDANRTHYYFDDRGNVVWAQTNTEASLIDAHWEGAIQAALVIYRAVGVNVSAQGLYDQLHRRGRTERVSPADTWGQPKPIAQPVSTANARLMVPPQLRRGSNAPAKPKPLSQPAQTTAPAPAVQPQPFGPQALPQPLGPPPNPFPLQPFVRAGQVWAGPQPLAPPIPVPQPQAQPVVNQAPPPHFGAWAQIPFDYSQLPPPPQFGGNPLAFVPVFEHPDEMDTDV
jgi:hypothetical protein